jgi:hypothetical protein
LLGGMINGAAWSIKPDQRPGLFAEGGFHPR